MSSNKCILFWRTRPALQSEGVGSQWTQHQSSTGLHTRWTVQGGRWGVHNYMRSPSVTKLFCN